MSCYLLGDFGGTLVRAMGVVAGQHHVSSKTGWFGRSGIEASNESDKVGL